VLIGESTGESTLHSDSYTSSDESNVTSLANDIAANYDNIKSWTLPVATTNFALDDTNPSNDDDEMFSGGFYNEAPAE